MFRGDKLRQILPVLGLVVRDASLAAAGGADPVAEEQDFGGDQGSQGMVIAHV